jgi:hypothetical protein
MFPFPLYSCRGSEEQLGVRRDNDMEQAEQRWWKLEKAAGLTPRTKLLLVAETVQPE